MKLPKRENLIVTNTEDPLNFYYYPVIGWVYRKRLVNTLALLGNEKFEKVLEIGFGSGILFPELSDRTEELHGIEIHDNVGVVKEKMAAEGLSPTLKQASIYDIPYGDNTFDCIIAVSTAEHLEDLDKAFQELRRVARPGAYIVLSFPVRNLITDTFYSVVGFEPRDLHPNSHNDILNAAVKHLDLVEVKKFPAFLPIDTSLYLCCLFSKSERQSLSPVREHFDQIAREYDYWKTRNSYYYQNIKTLYREYIEPGKNVLDFGCGTGGVLADLEPGVGIGFDISPEMLKLARAKFPEHTNLYFTSSQSDPVLLNTKYNYVILADVVEHLEDVPGSFRFIRSLCQRETRLIITLTPPYWEPILWFLEKLKLKMPEGPHERISFRKLRQVLSDTGFTIESQGTRLLIPTKSFPFADWINRNFRKIPILRKFGFIGYFVVRSKS